MQKKSIKRIIGISLGVLLLGGCGKVSKLSNGDDAVVSFKDSKISANDLYNELKDKYALEALVNMTDRYILETEFADSVETAKDYAESAIKSMKEQYGDESTLLQAIQYYTNYSTIEGYQEYIYLSYLHNQATLAYAKTLVSEKDIKKYYDKEVEGDIEASHILITSNVKSDATDDEKTAAEAEAKSKAEEIINKLNTAKKNNEDIKEVFANLAKEYSDDDSTKDNGGSLGRINKDTLSDAYDELVEALYNLKDGEYSTSVVVTELGYEVVYRSSSYEKDTLDNLKDSIIEKLANSIMEEEATISIDALDYYRKEYKMNIEDSELKKQYESYLKKALSQATSNKNQK